MNKLVAEVTAMIWSRRLLQRGAGLIEYALIVALLSLVTMAILVSLGGAIKQVFSNLARAM